MPGYVCPRCKARGQTWSGSEPKCGFTEDLIFTPENWNCATLNELRAILCDYPPYDSTRRIRVYGNDESVGIVYADVDGFDPGFILLHWYKDRGTTSKAYFTVLDTPIRLLTLPLAEKVLEAYSA